MLLTMETCQLPKKVKHTFTVFFYVVTLFTGNIYTDFYSFVPKYSTLKMCLQ